MGLARRAGRRPDRAVGCRRRRGRAGAAGRRHAARGTARAAPGAAVSAALLHRAAARRPGHQRNPCARRGAAGGAAWRCRWWPRTRCSSPSADDYEAHEARVCVAEGETLANPKRVKRFSREQYFKTQAQMEALFADLPMALANTLADRAALQPAAHAGQAAAAGLSDAAGRRRAGADRGATSARPRMPASSSGWRSSTPTRPSATVSARATPSGSSSRSRRS